MNRMCSTQTEMWLLEVMQKMTIVCPAQQWREEGDWPRGTDLDTRWTNELNWEVVKRNPDMTNPRLRNEFVNWRENVCLIKLMKRKFRILRIWRINFRKEQKMAAVQEGECMYWKCNIILTSDRCCNKYDEIVKTLNKAKIMKMMFWFLRMLRR